MELVRDLASALVFILKKLVLAALYGALVYGVVYYCDIPTWLELWPLSRSTGVNVLFYGTAFGAIGFFIALLRQYQRFLVSVGIGMVLLPSLAVGDFGISVATRTLVVTLIISALPTLVVFAHTLYVSEQNDKKMDTVLFK